MKMSPAQPKQFTLHIFPFHDVSVGQILIPKLFSSTLFPSSFYNLPQTIFTPPMPDPALISQKLMEEIFRIDPRQGLGRYTLPSPVNADTTLSEVIEMMVSTFGWKKEWISGFSIFPQPWNYPNSSGGAYAETRRSEKHGKTLQPSTTLAEVMVFDEDAASSGQFVHPTVNSDPTKNSFIPADRYWAPPLELVLETKAGALVRILGRSSNPDGWGLPKILGEEVASRKTIWNKLEMVQNHWMECNSVELLWTVEKWRGVTFAIKYYEKVKTRLVKGDLEELMVVEEKIRELTREEVELKQEIEKFVGWWERWVLAGDFNCDGKAKVIPYGEVEDSIQRVFYQRHIIAEWWKGDRKENLTVLLRAAYHSRQQLSAIIGDPHSLKIDNTSKKGSEAPTVSILSTRTQSNNKNKEIREREVSLHPFDIKLQHFEVRSGIVSFGQLLQVYFSSTQDQFTGDANSRPSKQPGGTIRRHIFTYKSLARKGMWKTHPWFSNIQTTDNLAPVFNFNGEGKGKEAWKRAYQGGWVVCHESVDPKELIQRVRAIGTSSTGPGAVDNLNQHLDRDIANVNRYDWSWHWRHPTNSTFENYVND